MGKISLTIYSIILRFIITIINYMNDEVIC